MRAERDANKKNQGDHDDRRLEKSAAPNF